MSSLRSNHVHGAKQGSPATLKCVLFNSLNVFLREHKASIWRLKTYWYLKRSIKRKYLVLFSFKTHFIMIFTPCSIWQLSRGKNLIIFSLIPESLNE